MNLTACNVHFAVDVGFKGCYHVSSALLLFQYISINIKTCNKEIDKFH